MRIAVDVGYSTTKGIADGSQVMFPSVTAPAGDDLLAGAILNTLSYRARIRTQDGIQDYLVGEAALQSASATGFLALREKPDVIHDLLLLTAARMLSRSDRALVQLEAAVGLPLAYYRSQRDGLRKRLEGLSAWVSVDGGQERCLQFVKVAVFPQGAGALMTAGELPISGLIALLDIGSYTTDYLVFDMRNGQPVPVPEGCGSIEAGVSLVTMALADEFQHQTGALLPVRMYETILAKVLAGEQIIYQGHQVDLSRALVATKTQVSNLIVSSVAAALRDRVGFLVRTYLAGGGAILFEREIAKVLPCATMIDDPVFANARGFMQMLLSAY